MGDLSRKGGKMVICHKCSEAIAVGAAMTQVPTPGGYNWWYFHPECFAGWSEELLKQETRLNNVRRMAGYTH